MKNLGKVTIREKLIIMLLTASSVGVLFVSIAFITNDLVSTRKHIEDRLRTDANMISINIATAFIFNDREVAAKMLESLSAEPAIERVAVIKDGEVFAKYIRHPEKEVLANQPLQMSSLVDKFHSGPVKGRRDTISVFELEYPMIVDGKNLGFIRMTVNNFEIHERIYYLAVVFFGVMILTTILALLISERLQKWISSPLLKLAEISYQVTSYGDYTLRSDIEGDDEIGLLSDNFNSMLEQIQMRDRMLEDKVEQRTHELEKLNDKLSYEAHHDVLTGLPNRTLYNDRAEQALKDAVRYQSKVAIVFIDLDNFKTINDTLGHDVGDKLLQVVAKRLVEVVRKADTVSRFGGDEFNVLLTRLVQRSDVEVIANKIQKAFQNPVQIETHLLSVTASIGIALYPDDATTVKVLKQHADTAMYAAKDLGKNKYLFFNEELNIKTNERLLLINDLRGAVSRNEFELVYQPKIDAKMEQVFGVETLIRWHHPEHGLLMPDRFIPYAEESGIIIDIDLWVLRTSCQQVQAWNKKYKRNIKLALNLSGCHFSSADFINVVNDVLHDTGLAAEDLEFELTERILVDSADETLKTLKALKALGIKLSIDDFGTGYSSLNYLRQFPIDIVKIDKSFIGDLTSNPDDATLTLAIILLTKSLGLDVIAEGVETVEQKDMLLAYGCNLMQGYYFYKPLHKDLFQQQVLEEPMDNVHYLTPAS